MAKKPRKGQRAKVPITRHPLFPAIVALWFAALFGLGSLAIRPGLLESAVLATHIDLLFPAAAPPLGITARIVLALTLALGGGALGAYVARRIAQPKVEARPLRRSGSFMKGGLSAQQMQDAGPARRPISAHEEIGESAIAAGGGGVVLGGRRRALAIEEEADEFHMFEIAPLPGGQPPVFHEPVVETYVSPVEEPQALDLSSFEPLPPTAEPIVEQAAIDPGPRQVFQPTAPAPTQSEPAPPIELPSFAAPVAPPIDFLRPNEVAAATIGAQPIDFSRPHAQAFPEPAPFAAPMPEGAPVVAPQHAEVAVSETAPSARDSGTGAVAAALDDLGLIELTERFAQTLRRRREKLSGADVSTPAAPAPAPVETAATSTGPEPASAPALPAFMRPIDLDAFDDDDDDSINQLPLRKFAPLGETAAAPEPATPDVAVGEAEDAEVADEAVIEAGGYSSLLDLVKQPEQYPQFVRIEEPDPASDAIEPVVIFPGQAACLGQTPVQPAPFAAPVANFEAPSATPAAAPAEPVAPAASGLRPFDSPDAARPGQAVAAAAPATVQDPAETERALRAALATLQRMSGAA